MTTERRERLLRTAAIGITVCSLPWLLFFGLRGEWLIASTHVLLLLGAIAVWVCARRSAINAGMLVLSAVAWLGIACIALAIDRPSGELPRTVQFFLVPLMAAQAFLIDKRWLRRLILLAGAVQFVAWSALPDLGLGPPPLAESERLGAAAMPLVAAWLLTGQVLRLQSRERREHTGLALDLAKAIAGDRLELHLQPQCDEQSRLVGAEALLRCCAGGTIAWAWCRPPASCAWPSSVGSSCRWGNGCCAGRSAWSSPGAVRKPCATCPLPSM